MPQVKFNYNIKKDAWSWVLIAKDKNLWGLDWKNETAHIPKNLLAMILKATFSRAVILTEKYIRKDERSRLQRLIIKKEIYSLQNSWQIVEKKYFKILSRITKKPIFSKQFNCFFTTGFMCPYNEKENWFMVSFWYSIPFSITTICHEIMHLQFLHYYNDYLKNKGLNDKQIDLLKEALTFLLNEPEFEEIILYKDGGYPEHQTLIKKLRNIWIKSRDFQNLLDRAVLLLQKNKSIWQNKKEADDICPFKYFLLDFFSD